jgi:hypothetical protein
VSAVKNRQNYLNNPNLPSVDAVHEYTPEMVAQIKKCSLNILYFAENFFHIVSLDEGKQTIALHPCQKRVLRKMRDNRFFVLLASRQIGKTTLMTIYALWIACFQKDQSILIVANKEDTAIEIFRRVRLAYEELPNWLKPGVKEYGKTSMALGNGTMIGISTTTGTAARGKSINVLILDELAFIDDGLVNDFWKSVYPIVSSSKKSKILIASTANGTGNLFYNLYTGAEQNKNGWACDKILWNEIPGRNELWKLQTMATIGSKEAFDQEFGCEFIDGGDSIIDDELNNRLNAGVKQPKYVMDEGCYQVWEEPKDDKIYVAGVDTSEGVGKDASVINIFDITDLTNIKQVACFHSNQIPPAKFVVKLVEILTQWGKPITCVERNSCGSQVVDNLRHYYNYENIVSWGASAAGREKAQLGIVNHTNTKFTGITNMRYWVNQLQVVQIRDTNLVKELKNFVRNPNLTWSAKKGTNIHDDRVMSMVWGLIVLDPLVAPNYFEIVQNDNNNRPLIIKQLDFGIKYFTSPNSMYNESGEYASALPFMFGGNNKVNDDMSALFEQGYRPLL